MRLIIKPTLIYYGGIQIKSRGPSMAHNFYPCIMGKLHPSAYALHFINVRFIIVITQCRVTIATKCGAFTRHMNVSYTRGHKKRAIICFSMSCLLCEY